MLNILNNIGRNVIRTSLVTNPVYAVSVQRVFFSDEIRTDESSTKTLSGFARAFEKFEKPENLTEPKPEDNATFLSLLRNSKFIDVSADSLQYCCWFEIFDKITSDQRWEIHSTKLSRERYTTSWTMICTSTLVGNFIVCAQDRKRIQRKCCVTWHYLRHSSNHFFQSFSSDYVRGAKVKLRVKDLELSSKFLGSSKDLTILEADCQLIGLVTTPRNATQWLFVTI